MGSPINATIGGCKTFWGGAPERGYLCLLEDSGKRECTLVSDLVKAETANEGQSRDAWEKAYQRGR